MLFSHVKITSFCAKAHLVFHWCLYNKSVTLFKPAGYFNFYWNSCVRPSQSTSNVFYVFDLGWWRWWVPRESSSTWLFLSTCFTLYAAHIIWYSTAWTWRGFVINTSCVCSYSFIYSWWYIYGVIVSMWSWPFSSFTSAVINFKLFELFNNNYKFYKQAISSVRR